MCGGFMAYEDSSNMLNNSNVHSESNTNEQQTVQQQLADANHQIEELKQQIAWLERSYE
jgi:TolA-binding protein